MPQGKLFAFDLPDLRAPTPADRWRMLVTGARRAKAGS
jgi:hypothetical protein